MSPSCRVHCSTNSLHKLVHAAASAQQDGRDVCTPRLEGGADRHLTFSLAATAARRSGRVRRPAVLDAMHVGSSLSDVASTPHHRGGRRLQDRLSW